MKLAQLLEAYTDPIPDCTIVGLCNDSRQIKPGYLFFAYPGAVADGRLYIQQAFDKGASAVLFDPENMPNIAFSLTPFCIPIKNLSQKLGQIASHFYQHPTRKLSVIGVTGTNGKTTIAYQLAQAHELLGEPSTYIGTLGEGRVTDLMPLANTTPDALCLQRLFHDYLQENVQNVCMEVSSHALELGRVENIDFCQAIFTNLTHDHLDFHETMQNYAKAKAKLFAFKSLKYAIINQDDEYQSMMCENLSKDCKLMTYGIKNKADVWATHWQSDIEGSVIDASTPQGTFQFRVNLLGEFNVYNSLAVVSSLLASGFSLQQITSIMPMLKASPGRMEVVAQKPCVVVDYAHTPDALQNALMTLQRLKEGRLWVVFGCGGDRDKTKRPVMGRIASQYADVVVITSDNPRHESPATIIEEIKMGLLLEIKAFCIEDRKEAIHKALNLADQNDVILIAGKGQEDYQQIGDERVPFSDQYIVKNFISIT